MLSAIFSIMLFALQRNLIQCLRTRINDDTISGVLKHKRFIFAED